MAKNHSVVIMAALLLLLCVSVTPARAEAAKDCSESFWEFSQNCLDDTRDILTSPGEWGRAGWGKAALAAGTALILYEQDEESREFFQKNRSKFGDDFSDFIGKTGNVFYLGPALGLWYYYGKRFGNAKMQEASLCGFESLLVAGGMTTVIKLAAHRNRPYTEAGSHAFDGPGLETDDDQLSLCSLHSAAAFSVATVVAEYYREQRWTPVVAYTTATLASLSRIYDDEHWGSDVFCGAVLGYYTAKKIVARRKKASLGNTTDETVSLTPQLTQDGLGLTLQYRF